MEDSVTREDPLENSTRANAKEKHEEGMKTYKNKNKARRVISRFFAALFHYLFLVCSCPLFHFALVFSGRDGHWDCSGARPRGGGQAGGPCKCRGNHTRPCNQRVRGAMADAVPGNATLPLQCPGWWQLSVDGMRAQTVPLSVALGRR